MFNQSTQTIYCFILLCIFTLLSFPASGYFLFNHTTFFAFIATFLVLHVLHGVNRWLFAFVIGVIGLWCSFYIPAALLYGTLSQGILFSLYETNSQEALEYLQSMPWYLSLLSVGFLVLTITVIVYATRNSQLATRNSQLATRNSQLATRNSQLATRNSQLATRNSQLATRNSQLATRNSQLA